jgi:hypothetical protein
LVINYVIYGKYVSIFSNTAERRRGTEGETSEGPESGQPEEVKMEKSHEEGEEVWH